MKNIVELMLFVVTLQVNGSLMETDDESGVLSEVSFKQKIHEPIADCSTDIFFPVTESGISQYPLKLTVFGITLYATSRWSIDKLNHAASIVAELLDQDEDGCADDPVLLRRLHYKNEFGGIPIQDDEKAGTYSGTGILLRGHDWEEPGGAMGENVGEILDDTSKLERNLSLSLSIGPGEDETKPECTGLNFTKSCSDASIEQLFYPIIAASVNDAHQRIFSGYWESKSKLTDALDIARGGRYLNPPSQYPSSAWFRFYDPDCDYICQSFQYLWSGYCVYSGMCEIRAGVVDYENEFKYLTQASLEAGDERLSKLFEESGIDYVLPVKHVDGKYHGCKKCSNGSSHGGQDISDVLDLLEMVY